MWFDKRQISLWIVLWICLGGFLADLSAETRITLRSQARTAGRQILLGEIATIAAEETQKTVLSQLALGFSPAPEIDRIITRAEIHRMLRKAGFSEEDGAVLDGAESVRVRAIMVPLHPEWVADSIRLELTKMFPVDQFRLESLKVSIQGRVLVPPNGTAMQPDFRHHKGKPDGMVTIQLFQNGKKYRTLLVRAEMSWEGCAPAAVRDLPMGARLEEQDIEWVRKVRQGFPFDLPLEQRSLAGMRLRQPVLSGELIRESVLLPERMIEKGDLVQVVVQGKGFSIQTTAVAGQSGVQGQKIRLIQTSSKRSMIGRVSGKQRAEINL